MRERSIDAVVFDLGGVLMLNGRPSDIAGRVPDGTFDQVIGVLMGPYHEDTDHPWHRLERGEVDLGEVRRLNRAALDAVGLAVPPRDPAEAGMRFRPNEDMFQLVRDLRGAGLATGMLTNNVREFRPMWWPLAPWGELFDDVVDSHEVGMRKPNPAIYRLSLERLGVTAGRTAFLDDVASNVAAAQAVGMIGIHVGDDAAPAIAEVAGLAGLAR